MNSKNNNSPAINEQAAEWVLKQDRGLSPAEQDAFTDWLSQSEAHRSAYAEHHHAWEDLARLAGLQNTDYAPVVPDLLGAHFQPWYRKFPNRNIVFSIAASLLLMVSLFTFNRFWSGQSHPPAGQSIVVNHIRQMDLEDGSVVDLNEGTVIETLFSREERLVRLVSGEANFKVAKDTSRPFIVEVSGVRLRAVGTIFNVRMENQMVDVVVTEGIVAVRHAPSKKDSSPAGVSLIKENFRAIVDLKPENPQVSVHPVKTEDLHSELLWQPRLIDFENAPLSRIVEEFNRRNPVLIEVEDETIGSLRFTSIFWSNNVQSFVRLLEANYGISAEVINDKWIILRAKQAAL